jgi:hypothetical protein
MDPPVMYRLGSTVTVHAPLHGDQHGPVSFLVDGSPIVNRTVAEVLARIVRTLQGLENTEAPWSDSHSALAPHRTIFKTQPTVFAGKWIPPAGW